MVVINYDVMYFPQCMPKHHDQCLAGIMTSHQLHGVQSTAPFKQPTNACTCITTNLHGYCF